MAEVGEQRQQQADNQLRRVRTVMALATVVLIALLAIACSSQTATDVAGSDPDPVVEETTEATGDPTTSTTAAPTTAVPTTEAPELEPMIVDAAFSTGVQPILEQTCASCHAPEQAGSAHFELATAADAQEWSELLFDLTHTGVMPPWPASDLSVPFEGDPRLSDSELASIAAWVEGGAELDVDPATPIVSVRAPSFIADTDRDVVMTPAAGPYTGSPERRDDYPVFDL